MKTYRLMTAGSALLATTALVASGAAMKGFGGDPHMQRRGMGLPQVNFAPDGGAGNAPQVVELSEKALSDMIAAKLAELMPKAIADAVAPLNQQVTDNIARLTVPAAAKAEKIKGQDVSRCIQALAASKGIPSLAADFAQKKWGSEADGISKALSASIGVSGGFLVPEAMSAEVIELLRPASVFMSFAPRSIPLPNGNMTMSGIGTGTQASYIGEQQNVPATGVTTRQVKLSAKKLAALVAISNDLLKFQGTSQGADELVRDDLVRSLAQRTDLAFIRGAGTENTPKGLRYLVQPANVLACNATVNLANITLDLGRIELALIGNEIPMIRPGWIMAPRTYIYLSCLRDGNGNIAFPEMANMMLRGKPLKFTTQVPVNLAVTGTNESEIYLTDFANVLIGDVGGIELAVSEEAAYHDGTSIVSPFSRDETVIRAIWQHDMNLRQAYTTAVLKDVDWF